MPARKRKASTKVTAPAKKKVRIEEDPVPDEAETSIPSRPKRTSISTPQYNLTRPRQTNKKQTDVGSKVKETATSNPDAPKRRGRPSKNATTTSAAAVTASDVGPVKRSRGRPVTKPDDPEEEEPVVKKRGRGRPRKLSPTNAITAAERKEAKPVKTPKARQEVPRNGVGRLPKKNLKTKAALKDISVDDTSDADALLGGEVDSDDETGERQYWLMKAEPNDRFENGINVKFSIDDLAAAEGPEPWDGVRNYVARNNMRAMRRGDLAFFYHSNCPVPGIVGIMRVVQEHTTDKSAFDPNHPYYDPKSSPSNPKWDCVHVEFVKKFDTQVTLKMLQNIKSKNGVLADMQLLRQSRLSVSGVTRKEWRFVLGMAGEEETVGEDGGVAGGMDGYESETDGEAHAGPNEELNGVIANGLDGFDGVDEHDEEGVEKEDLAHAILAKSEAVDGMETQ